jgi:hypothetical protein
MWKWDRLNYKKDINKLGFQMWLKPILLAISIPALKGGSIKYIDDSFHRPDVYCLSRLRDRGLNNETKTGFSLPTGQAGPIKDP